MTTDNIIDQEKKKEERKTNVEVVVKQCITEIIKTTLRRFTLKIEEIKIKTCQVRVICGGDLYNCSS